jgi:hypothetical protein
MTLIIDCTTPEKLDAFCNGVMDAARTGEPVSLQDVAEQSNTISKAETEHFFIEYHGWNEGNHPYAIMPKLHTVEEAKRERCVLPPQGAYNCAKTAELLYDRLIEAESWYVKNRDGLRSRCSGRA